MLGFGEDPEDPNEPGHDECKIVEVPESKQVMNRIHFDLRPLNNRESEVERLRALGATLVADRRRPDGSGWVTLADPEGNEFCVLRGDAEFPIPTGAWTRRKRSLAPANKSRGPGRRRSS